jgi:hypothetical protein
MTNPSHEHQVDLTHHPHVRLQWTGRGDHLTIEYHAEQPRPTEGPPISEEEKEHIRQLQEIIRSKLLFFFRRQQELGEILGHLQLDISLSQLEGREMEDLVENLIDRCVTLLCNDIVSWQQILDNIDKHICRSRASDTVRLRTELSTFFDDNSFRVFCHDLSGRYGLRVRYDDLPGETKDVKVVYLIDRFRRRRRLRDLATAFVAKTGYV